MPDHEHSHGHPIMMAGIAQKMLAILNLNCPANYPCGGPSYAGVAAVDSILHLMGIGRGMLSRVKRVDTTDYQKRVREGAVCGPTILGQLVQHKSQILAGALYTMLINPRDKELREIPEVTENALLSLLHWYFQKSGTDPQKFIERLKDGSHDEVVQLEKML